MQSYFFSPFIKNKKERKNENQKEIELQKTASVLLTNLNASVT